MIMKLTMVNPLPADPGPLAALLPDTARGGQSRTCTICAGLCTAGEGEAAVWPQEGVCRILRSPVRSSLFSVLKAR